MAIGRQLAVFCQSLEWLTLPLRFVARYVIKDARLKNEERSVDPTFLELRLLGETRHPVTVEIELPEAGRRSNSGYCREFAVRFVESEELVQIDVRNAITPRQKKSIAVDVLRKSLDAPAGRRLLSGFDEIDRPILSANSGPVPTLA